MFNFLTANRKKFWAERKIDWEKDYFSTWTHPHRALITQALKSFNWISLWEVGVGGGANVMRIIHDLGLSETNVKQVFGSDVNPDAVEYCNSKFVGGKFSVESVEDLFLGDNSVDVMLSDATLIYIGPGKIKKALGEMCRAARNRILLCEFHGESFWKRWWLRLTTGYNAYDYKKLLEEQGCYDIQVVKMPPELWEGFPWQPWGHVILARIAKKV